MLGHTVIPIIMQSVCGVLIFLRMPYMYSIMMKEKGEYKIRSIILVDIKRSHDLWTFKTLNNYFLSFAL